MTLYVSLNYFSHRYVILLCSSLKFVGKSNKNEICHKKVHAKLQNISLLMTEENLNASEIILVNVWNYANRLGNSLEEMM